MLRFTLPDNAYVLDGEIDPSGVLVRRPIMLLEVNYLRCLFDNNKGSLGNCFSKSDESPECKVLDTIPSDNCFLFGADAELKHRRVELAKKKQGRDGLEEMELKMFGKDWGEPGGDSYRNLYRHFASNFTGFHGHPNADLGSNSQVRSSPSSDEPLRTLCPVTWKTIEIYFKRSRR